MISTSSLSHLYLSLLVFKKYKPTFKKGRGYILLHDQFKTAKYLPKLLTYLTEQGNMLIQLNQYNSNAMTVAIVLMLNSTPKL